MKSSSRSRGADTAPPPPSQPSAGFSIAAAADAAPADAAAADAAPAGRPDVVLLGAPHALARSMAHALQQAWQEQAPGDAAPWRCLAPNWGEAWPQQTAQAAVFLLGLDWRVSRPDDPLQRQIALWRSWLQQHATPYIVLYGSPAAQWQQLAQSLQSMAPGADWDWIATATPGSTTARLRPRGCEQCAAPECERRLFDALLRDRGAAP